MQTHLRVALFFWIVVAPVGRSFGCPICFPVPVKSAADYLIESEYVVFARENPDRPFSYLANESLKGDSFQREIGLFVDSTTRRQLKLNPGDVAILVRKSKKLPWKSLGVANKRHQEVIRRILFYAKDWSRKDGIQKRLDFFLPLLASKNRAIFELAYLELGRMPYSEYKRMAQFLPKRELLRLISNPQYVEWRPLAILLLAQNPNESDRKLIEDTFQDREKHSLTINLAAWCAAYIEVKGTQAVDEVEENYLSDPGRTKEEVLAVIAGLSVHGHKRHSRLKDQITRAYGTALVHHPNAAGSIARDLTAWDMQGYRDQMTKIRKSSIKSFDAKDAESIINYIK